MIIEIMRTPVHKNDTTLQEFDFFLRKKQEHRYFRIMIYIPKPECHIVFLNYYVTILNIWT